MRGWKWALLLAVAGLARAHFALIQPASALSVENGGKGAPPCGEGPESGVVSEAQGGRPIAIRLNEFIFHPGHYRFALSVNSQAELPPDPDVVSVDDISVSASIQNPVRIPVLADGVFAHTSPASADWQISLTLPNLSCDRCTLQIIEFMAEHGPNPGGGYFYHHCADLRIKADPALPPADPAWPRAVAQTRSIAPHITFGGGWSTVLNVYNPTAAPVPATLTFRGDDGSSIASPAAVVISPNATVSVPAGDASAGDNTVGWADVLSAGSLSGYVLIRSGGGEAAAPLQSPSATLSTSAYDNRGASLTGVAIANPSAASATVTAKAFDEAGSVLGSFTLTLQPNGHTSFVLADRIPATAGARGVVRFEGAAGVAALTLRFAPSGTFLWLPGM